MRQRDGYRASCLVHAWQQLCTQAWAVLLARMSAAQLRNACPKGDDSAAQVLHFVAWRKVGMQVVYEAFMQRGVEAAYKVPSLSSLLPCCQASAKLSLQLSRHGHP